MIIHTYTIFFCLITHLNISNSVKQRLNNFNYIDFKLIYCIKYFNKLFMM